jgi:hypothetical protein
MRYEEPEEVYLKELKRGLRTKLMDGSARVSFIGRSAEYMAAFKVFSSIDLLIQIANIYIDDGHKHASFGRGVQECVVAALKKLLITAEEKDARKIMSCLALREL